MKPSLVRVSLAFCLLGVAGAPAVQAEQAAAAKTLPTLIIKGEVVSLDVNDPTVSVLKVKDRYGFETPIQVTAETKITKGEEALTSASLTPGSTVEVEYNFDINTAKRHAVRVDVSAAPAAAEAPAEASTTTTVETEIDVPQDDVPEAAAPAEAAPEPVTPPADAGSTPQ